MGFPSDNDLLMNAVVGQIVLGNFSGWGHIRVVYLIPRVGNI
jgi:hypothetical protein